MVILGLALVLRTNTGNRVLKFGMKQPFMVFEINPPKLVLLLGSEEQFTTQQ